MSYYFYNVNELPIIICPPPNIDAHKKKLASVQCNALFHKTSFMSAPFMHSLTCLIEWMLFANSDTNKNAIPRPRRKWFIQNYIVLGKGVSSRINQTYLVTKLNGLPFAIKTPRKDYYKTTHHEYMVGRYGINRLRNLCPNFMYTMSIFYNTQKELKLVLEKIRGETFSLYIKNLIHKKYSPDESREFLKHFIQIILSLELGQETVFFTHYDLHAGNIIVKKVTNPIPKLRYPIFDGVYEIDDVKHIPTIIDFGHSCIKYEKGFIGSIGSGAFPEYGMYPFYIPGVDLFKLLFSLWKDFFMEQKNKKWIKKQFDIASMGIRLFDFFDYLLSEFYHIQIINPKANYPPYVKYMDPASLFDSFYNGTHLTTIYRSPLQLLTFLKRCHKKILTYFGIQDFPWKITSSHPYYMQDTKPSQQLTRCFQETYCTSLIHQSDAHKIFSLSWRTTDTHKGIEVFEKILTSKNKNIPHLGLTDVKLIEAYLRPVDDWEAFTQKCDYIATKIRQGKEKEIDQVTFSYYHDNIDTLMYFYRIFICLTGYVSYLHYRFKKGKTEE